MITLNDIKECILNDDEGLELLLFNYFNQIIDNDSNVTKQASEIKDKLKNEIEESILKNNLEDAKNLLGKYKKIANGDLSIYSIEGIIAINENNIEKAFDTFLEGLKIDNRNVDLLYNMAQLATIIGDIDSSIYYYNECLEYTEDIKLTEEVEDALKSVYSVLSNKRNMIITIGFEKLECNLFSQKYNLINIIERISIEGEEKSENDNYIQYAVNSNDLMSKIKLLIKYNQNCILVFKNTYAKKIINEFYGKVKLGYYIDKNNYTNKINYYRNSIELFDEKDICNIVDYIITDNINVYNCKKSIECRNNIFFINEKIEFEDKNQINKYFKSQFENINDQYNKQGYLLALEDVNSEQYMELAKYSYEKYNTEEFYHIYISLLNRNKKYEELLNVIVESNYSDDIFKSECLYLYKNNEEELFSFIVNLSIKNYKMVDGSLNSINKDYKLAAYNFEIENRNEAFDIYYELNKKTKKFHNSPIVNRNMYHLLYLQGNKDYIKYEDRYNKILNDILIKI